LLFVEFYLTLAESYIVISAVETGSLN